MKLFTWKASIILVSLSMPVSLFACSFATAQVRAETVATSEDTAYITAENNLDVADELAIRQIIARLNHSLDSADYALYASFFSEDAVFNTAFGEANGRDPIAAAMEASRPFITNKRHVAANLVISGSGDRAQVASYLIVFERAKSLDYVGSAINFDTLEKQNGQWKVVRHETEMDPATLEAMQAIMSDKQQ